MVNVSPHCQGERRWLLVEDVHKGGVSDPAIREGGG